MGVSVFCPFDVIPITPDVTTCSFDFFFLVTLENADVVMDEAIEGKVFNYLNTCVLQNELLFNEVYLYPKTSYIIVQYTYWSFIF